MSRSLRSRIAAPLAALALLTSVAAVRASDAPVGPQSRIGVVMAAVCGLSARLSPIAPVPYAGIAVVTCAVAFIDAWRQPD